MPKIKLSYIQAVNYLGSYLGGLNHNSKSDELLATITHWLQNPDEKPVYYRSKDNKNWKEYLRRYALLTNGKPGLDKQLKGKYPKWDLEIAFDVPFPSPRKPKFTFIDLFAGIGGFRIALQKLGGKCVFSSDWNDAAKMTYYKNFGEIPFGDITQFTSPEITKYKTNKLIPDHTILAAGFPCQPFSRAGVSARNFLGQPSGLECEVQGHLFYEIIKVAKAKKPDVLFLENVKDIISDDDGNTFATIKNLVEKDLKYDFKYAVLDSCSLVPQHRERCYIVCFRNKNNNFNFPKFKYDNPLNLNEVLEAEVSNKYTISDKLWIGHINRSRRNTERGTGFTVRLADVNKPCNTLVARYGKDGKECLIPQPGKNPRKLTPRECARILGFPESFIIPDKDSPAYKQFGNSVAIPVIYEIGKRIINTLNKLADD